MTATVGTMTAETTAGGWVEMYADGSFSYTALEGFVGQDTFTYLASDTAGGVSEASVYLEIVPDESEPIPESPPYYVEGLIFGDPYRLNPGADYGTAVQVSYSFLEVPPDYYASDSPQVTDFTAMTDEQKEAVRQALAEIEFFQISNLSN